ASPSRRRAQTWCRVPVALVVQRVDRRTVRPSGIPVAVVCGHGAVVSTGFPSPDAGWGARHEE
ncbi:MAG: hypothetical protein V3U08_09070, partial [Nitrospirales bacterium]